MAKIIRTTQNIFGSQAEADEIAVFGTMKTGTPVYSNDLATLQGNPAYTQGWQDAIQEDRAPYLEETNGLYYGLTSQLAYQFQEGVAEYDIGTTYYKGSLAKVLDENDVPDIYYSLTDNNIGNPVTDTANWALWNVAGLETDMSNIAPGGYEKLEAQKAYLTGNVLTDEKGYAEVLEASQSTFDLSKFTVFGNPIISANGVASGFSNSNYITANVDVSDKSFVFESASFICNSFTSNLQFLLNWGNPLSSGLYLASQMNSTGILSILVKNDTTELLRSRTYQIVLGNKYQFKVVLNSSIIQIYIKENDGYYTLLKSTANSSLYTMHSTLMYVGHEIAGSTRFLNGSIDLKTIKITADGREIFNGAKTGLDVIKPDNYTVVGSPTITEDGVASGFSQSSFVRTTSLDLSAPFVIYASETIGPTMSGIYSTNINVQPQGAGGGFYLVTRINGQYTAPYGVFANASQNSVIFYKLSWDGQIYKLEVRGDVTTNWVTITSKNSTTAVDNAQNTVLNLGWNQNALQASTGEYDLNNVKCFNNDNNLIYQPCLKVPYSRTKTGSKIVDVSARDRVQDVYNQYGEALYYTLDTTNQNYTIPMGEVYGMITGINKKIDIITTELHDKADADLSNVSDDKGILVESYVNGTSKYNVYSNGFCEQWAEIGLGKPVTLLKEFKDTNYNVIFGLYSEYGGEDDGAFCPYIKPSTKTTSGFSWGVIQRNAFNRYSISYYACGYIA